MIMHGSSIIVSPLFVIVNYLRLQRIGLDHVTQRRKILADIIQKQLAEQIVLPAVAAATWRSWAAAG